MKLLDRHILRSVSTPLAYCLIAFMMLFIIFDLFSHLSDFIEAGTPISQVVQYYVFLLPSVAVYVVPISLLLGVLYGLSQLTRNNELTAMRACGMSLYRLMLPIIGLGLLGTLIVALINETIGPRSAYWTDQFVKAEKHSDDISFHITSNLPYRDPEHNRVWMLGAFNRLTFEMDRIEVIQQREDGSDAVKYHARSGQWLDGRWWFTEVVTQQLDRRGYPMGAPITEPRREMLEFTEQPRDFINVTKDPEFLSSRELIYFLGAHQHVSRDTLARFEVDLHYRLAMPWTCLIVTLLGLPIGAHTGRKGAFRGIAMAIGLFFGFYVLINFGMALGKNQTLPPALSVWLPNFLYLALAIVLVRRMR